MSYLYSNNIGVAGAEALGSYLIQKPNNSLEILRLSYNCISDEGANAMAEAISTNRVLAELTLKHNKLHEKGILALGNALYSNNTLQLLTLVGK